MRQHRPLPDSDLASAEDLTRIQWITDIVARAKAAGMTHSLIYYHLQHKHVRMLEIAGKRWYDVKTVDALLDCPRGHGRRLASLPSYRVHELAARIPRLRLQGTGHRIRVVRADAPKPVLVPVQVQAPRPPLARRVPPAPAVVAAAATAPRRPLPPRAPVQPSNVHPRPVPAPLRRPLPTPRTPDAN